ncbi:MAG: 2,3-dihydroxyphenylpropionate 1,2-dioxygenase [Cryptosporangiaceae bacterium]|nr:2,3-dihydroxyphenylpropionate 1,2-dioxygenase [Cryptosporangiaceae bacterium]
MSEPAEHNRLTVCASHLITLPPEIMPGGGTGVRAAIRTAQEAVAAFSPDLVVMFGTDHRRAFREVVPTFSVVLSAEARGDVHGPTGRYDVPEQLARDLAADLVAHDFDIAVTHHAALDHAFGHTVVDLLGAVGAVPLVPVFVNCASPPLPSFARAAALGRQAGSFLAGRAERILFVGSGGLAHDLPGFRIPDDGKQLTEDERQLWIRTVNAEARAAGTIRTLTPEWDLAFLAGLSGTSTDWLPEAGRDIVERAGNGAQEALTWTAAWAAGAEPLTTLAHEFTTSGRAVVGSAWAFAAAP